MKKILYCNFCGKSQDEVCQLVAGPGVFICDECTELAWKIVNPLKRAHAAAEEEYLSW